MPPGAKIESDLENCSRSKLNSSQNWAGQSEKGEEASEGFYPMHRG